MKLFVAICAIFCVSAVFAAPADTISVERQELNEKLFEATKEGQFDAVKLLIELGADAKATNQYLWTPLHLAAANGQSSIAQFLIENGADVNAKDEDGSTPLEFADIEDGLVDRRPVVELLKNAGAH